MSKRASLSKSGKRCETYREPSTRSDVELIQHKERAQVPQLLTAYASLDDRTGTFRLSDGKDRFGDGP
jgi:hypothetical protein